MCIEQVDMQKSLEPIVNYSHVEIVIIDSENENEQNFIIKHTVDRTKDKECKIIWTGEKTHEWKGLPTYMRQEMTRFKILDLKNCPDFCLTMLL